MKVRVKLSYEGKQKLASARNFVPPVVPIAPAGARVSVARVAEILSVSEDLVKHFFISTQDHRRYPSDVPLNVLFKLPNRSITFNEGMLMVWLDANYKGMKELYYVRKQEWLRRRAQQ